jgi:hypothetical protein
MGGRDRSAVALCVLQRCWRRNGTRIWPDTPSRARSRPVAYLNTNCFEQGSSPRSVVHAHAPRRHSPVAFVGPAEHRRMLALTTRARCPALGHRAAVNKTRSSRSGKCPAIRIPLSRLEQTVVSSFLRSSRNQAGLPLCRIRPASRVAAEVCA